MNDGKLSWLNRDNQFSVEALSWLYGGFSKNVDGIRVADSGT